MSKFEPLEFIDIDRHHRGGQPDRASLQIDRKTGRLRVLGGLDHTTEFEPADLDAALAMMKWLAGWMRDRHQFEYRIGLSLEGGVVQSVFSPHPDLIPTAILVIDYDTEGALPEDGLRGVIQEDGTVTPAFVGEHGLSKMRIAWPDLDVPADVAERLEYLRGELRAERISYEEITELQDLAEHIDPSDVELAEPAGLPDPNA